MGIRVEFSDLTVDRMLIEGVRGWGMAIGGGREGLSAVLMRDILVRGTPEAGGYYGRGIQMSDGVAAKLERVAVVDMADVGLIVGASESSELPAGEVEIADLLVRDTQSAPMLGGNGVVVGAGAQASITRAQVLGNRGMGLTARGWGATPQTRLTLRDVVVSGTQPERCVEYSFEEGGCSAGDGHEGGGSGVSAIEGARLYMEGFVVSGNALTGVYIDEDSVVRADRGDIVDNSVGVYSGPGPEALEEWFEDVRLFDNGTDFVRSELPLPEPAEILEI